MKQASLSTSSRSRGARIRNGFADFCGIAALGIFALIFAYLSVSAFIGTTDMNTENRALENVEFLRDSFLLNLVWTVLFTAALLGLGWLIRKVNLKILRGVTVLVVLFFGILWVLSALSAPTHDSLIVSRAAYQASEGDYSGITSDYFRRFPFQLGYVFFDEMLTRLFHLKDWYLGMELINVAFLALAYDALLRFMERVFKNETVVRLTALLMLTCVPPILFCTFTYGNIPGIAFGCLGLWQLSEVFAERKPTRSEKAHRIWTAVHAVLCAVCLGLSASIKLNCMILFVAAAIILVLRLIRRPALRESWKALLTLGLCVLCVWGIPAGIQKQYEARADFVFGDGIPMTSWVAMGLNEAFVAPGWYSYEYTVGNFSAHNYDPVAAGEVSKEVIRARLDTFREDPGYAADFFDKKLRSQWNEPSYQSIWTNQVRGQYGAKNPWAAWVCGDGEYTVKAYMNVFQQSVFLLALAAAVLLMIDAIRGKLRQDHAPLCEGLLLFVTVIGGFLYHALAEAKSQYSLVYLILLLPLAAFAAGRLYDAVIGKAIPAALRRMPSKKTADSAAAD